MLTLYRRHQKPCIITNPYAKVCTDGQKHKNGDTKKFPGCPMWIRGILDGVPIRKSLKVRSWERAEEMKKEMEASGRPKQELITVAYAVERFIADRTANVTYRSVKKYRVVVNNLKEYCEKKGIIALKHVTLDNLREFREGWKVAPTSAYKNTEYLKKFFRFCHENAWIPTNTAKPMKTPPLRHNQTPPFTEDECQKIFKAASEYGTKPKRLLAFCLTLRWTGLRIGDVATLRIDAVNGNTVFIPQTQKTQAPVWCPVPPEVIEALHSFPPTGKEHFFWNGGSGMNSLLANWHRALDGAFKKAKVPNAHPHRFRDTFSCSLLAKAVPMETVSVLLAHSSIRITEKHYAPWDLNRQNALTTAVESTWKKEEKKDEEKQQQEEIQERPKLVRVK